MRHHLRPLVLAATAAVGLLAAAGAAVASTGTFTDVPTTHPFRTEIMAIASGGIAEGYPDGRYRPTLPVSRQTMAAFLVRGLGRAAHQSGAVTATGTTDRTIATVTLEHAASGYVVLNGATSAAIDADHLCPCLVETRLASGASRSPASQDELGNEEHPGGEVVAATANTWVVPVHGAGTSTFSLLGRRVNATSGSPVTTFDGSLTAQFVPFDGGGTFSG
jgi:hypothetical protein